MEDSIRVGVIGAGFIGPAHIEALRRLGGIEVVALAASSRNSAEAKARALRLPRAYGDWRELIGDSDVQVVHNCAPNVLHRDINLAVLAARKSIVSEKPLGINAQETAEMVQAADQAGVVNAIVFNYRMYPLVQQARAMIAAGELGRIILVHGAYLQDWLLYESDYNWRVDPAQGGPSRAIADIGSHWCDLVEFVSGLRITKLCADLTTVHPIRYRPRGEVETFAATSDVVEREPIDVQGEDQGGILLRFENGAPGACLISQVAAGHKNDLRLEVNGLSRSLLWAQENPEVLWIGRRDGPSEILPKDPALLRAEVRRYAQYPGGHGEAYPDGLRNLLRNVYDFIREGRDPRYDPCDFPTFRDGHRSALIVEAILRSHRERGWVEVLNQ